MSAVQDVFDAERKRRRQIQIANAHRLIDLICIACTAGAVLTGQNPSILLLSWIAISLAAIRRIIMKRNIDA